MTSTHYDILGVSKNASIDEIKKSYRRLAMQYHPDKNQSLTAQEQFTRIQDAYHVLSDAAQRVQYDQTLQNPFQALDQFAEYDTPTEAPLDPITGRKNYKYYRTNHQAQRNATDKVWYSLITKPKAHLHASRYWLGLVLSYLAAFSILSLSSDTVVWEAKDYLWRCPLLIFACIHLIDQCLSSQTRTGKAISIEPYKRRIEENMIAYGHIVKFYISDAVNRSSDPSKYNSRLEAIDFNTDFCPSHQERFVFHLSPLFQYCGKITMLSNPALTFESNTKVDTCKGFVLKTASSIIVTILISCFSPQDLHTLLFIIAAFLMYQLKVSSRLS